MRMLFAGLLAVLVLASPAKADDTLRIAVGQRGLWDTSVAELGQRGGIFKKHGIVLDILYTQGGGETQQAVISGSVELGSSAGVLGVFGAYAKGAPLRIIGAEMTGGGDLFWYVQTASPIRSLADTDGKTIAYSTNGASTHAIVNAFMRAVRPQGEAGRDRQPGCDADASHVRPGRRRLGRAAVRPRPHRPEQNPHHRVGQRRERVPQPDGAAPDHQCGDARGAAPRDRALHGGLSRDHRLDVFRPGGVQALFRFHRRHRGHRPRGRDGFYPKAALDPDTIVGIDAINADAVAFKYMAAPLTREQLAELIQIPPR